MDIVRAPTKLLTQSMPGTVALLDGFSAAPEAPAAPKADSTSGITLVSLGLLTLGAAWLLIDAASGRPTKVGR